MTPEEKARDLINRIRNPWDYEGFDPNNPFKDTEKLRSELNELTKQFKLKNSGDDK